MATNTGGSARKWKPEHVRRLINRKETYHKGLTRVSQWVMYIPLPYLLLKSAVNAIFHFKVDNDVTGEGLELATICAGIVTFLWLYFVSHQSQEQMAQRKKEKSLANDIAAAVEAATDDDDLVAAWKALALLATLNKKTTPEKKALLPRVFILPSNSIDVSYCAAERAIFYINHPRIRQPNVSFGRLSIMREYKCVSLIFISIMAFSWVLLTFCYVKMFTYLNWYIPPFYLLFLHLYNYEVIATWHQERDVELLAKDLYHIVTAHAHAELVCDTAVCCGVSSTSNQFCQDDASHAG